MTGTSNLVPKALTDRNGVNAARWVKPFTAQTETAAALPAPAAPQGYASPADEQKALYTELIEKLEGKDQFKTRIIRISNLHDQNWGQRALFRTFLKNISATQPLTFIEDTHNVLIEYGTVEPYLLLDKEALDAAERIMKATGNHMIPSRMREEQRHVREYINYALTSEDRELLVSIIAERKPEKLKELKTLHTEFKNSSVPLRNGVL